MKKKLTKNQKEVLDFIRVYIEENNIAPFIREIQECCYIKCYKAVVDRLAALEKKGYISREFGKHRGIKILRVEGG